MQRREFIVKLAAGAFASGVCGSGVQCAWAEPVQRNGRALVVVFLRGGCDGLNVVVPYADDAYHNARPTIRIRPPSAGDAGSALDLDGFFGLHPALAPLYSHFQAGELALLPTVHFPGAPMSHFECVAAVEQAGTIEATGWLNRYLATVGNEATGLAIGNVLPTSLRGQIHVPSYTDPLDLTFASNERIEAVLERVIGEAYLAPTAPLSEPAAVWFGAAQALAADRAHVRTAPPPAATYSDTAFGHDLANAAALLKIDPGVAVMTLSLSGWDTHSQQGGVEGEQATLLANLAQGLAAFMADLGPRRHEVAMLVQTEFGRRLVENASRGTDHGRAATWMLLGEGLRGGIYLGTRGWPGLGESALEEGRYLTHTVDYRDVYAELLQGHLGCPNLEAVLPDRPREIVGFI